MNIFTLEVCWINGKKYVRAHRGSFEENRDCLSPEMVATKEVIYNHQLCTPRKDLRNLAKEYKATVLLT